METSLSDPGRSSSEAELLARIWTVPNAITISRLALAAGFVASLFVAHNRYAAFAFLALAGITDFLDGYVARRFDQVTTLGKVIDPLVDRVVLITAAIAIVVFGAVPVWLVAVVAGRDALVSVVVLVLAALGAARIDVNWFGKAGTFGLMCAFPLMVLAHGPGVWTRPVIVVAWVIVIPALGLLAIATAMYVPAARQALATGRTRAEGSTV